MQVTLPCRVHNKIGIIQWTRDGFGLGDTRDLSGYSRYKLIGSDDESKKYFVKYVGTGTGVRWKDQLIFDTSRPNFSVIESKKRKFSQE